MKDKAHTSVTKEHSPAEMAREERQWQAERMVREAMCNTPEYNKAVKLAERELARADRAVKGAVKGKKK